MFGALVESGNPDEKFFALSQFKPIATPLRKIDEITTAVIELQNGDLIRVFNSITDGRKLMALTVDFVHAARGQNFQKDMDHELWYALCANHLPAKLKKPDGRIIDGTLNPFTEQGMEGYIAWSLFDFKNDSYNSLHPLETGDELTIFTEVTQGNILWQNRLAMEDKVFVTGQQVNLVSFNPLADPDVPGQEGIRIEIVPERYVKTLQKHDHDVLKELSLYNMPVQLVR